MCFAIFASPFSGYGNRSIDSMKAVLNTTDLDSVTAHTLNKISYAFYKMNVDSSMLYAEKAWEFSKKNGLKNEELTALNHIGRCYMFRNQFAMAMRTFENAFELHKKYGNEDGAAQVMISIAIVFRRMDRSERAIEYDSAALLVFQQNTKEDRLRNISIAYNNLGMNFMDLDEFEKAETHFSEVKKIVDINNDHFLELHYYLNMAEVYLYGYNDYGKAIEYNEEAMKISRSLDAPLLIGVIHQRLGKIYTETGDFKKAVHHLDIGVTYYDSTLAVDLLHDNRKYNALLSKAMGDFEKAYEYQREYTSSMDSLFKKENTALVAEFEVMHELLEKENEILALEHEKEKQKSRNIMQTGLIIIIIMVFLFVSVYLRLRIKKTRLQKELMKDELDIKDRQLADNALTLVQKNEMINKITEKLSESTNNFKPENRGMVQNIINELQTDLSDESWNEFESRFSKIHTDFYEKLLIDYPGLTPNDLKLCALLRLNLSSKEIASVNRFTVSSVEVARSRIRKKMQLTIDINLVHFIMQY